MIRELAKTATCHALAFARLEAWLEARVPVVIGYHQVTADAAPASVMPGLAISAAMLARHLDWIGRRCRFAPLDEVAEAFASGRRDEPLCAVTFDDGYAGVHRHALPVLRAKGIPAAVFVVTALPGTPLLHDRLYSALVAHGDAEPYTTTRALLGRLEPDELEHVIDRLDAGRSNRRDDDARSLTWDEIVALHAAGMTIGSHTASHAHLVGLEPERLAMELAGSRRALEQRLGAPVEHFAYPDGQFDRATVTAVERAGYRFAYTVCRHRDPQRPLLTIPRVMLWQRSSLAASGRFSGSVLACQMYGGWLFDHCDREHVRA